MGICGQGDLPPDLRHAFRRDAPPEPAPQRIEVARSTQPVGQPGRRQPDIKLVADLADGLLEQMLLSAAHTPRDGGGRVGIDLGQRQQQGLENPAGRVIVDFGAQGVHSIVAQPAFGMTTAL